MGEGSNDPGNEPASPDSALLSHLVQLLSQQPRRSLFLSDLGALLPSFFKQRVKDRGGLRNLLQHHPNLFAVSGQLGKESVMLTDGAPELLASEIAAAEPEPAAQPTEEPGDAEEQAAVQLRGLPYRATIEDVVDFLGSHSSLLADGDSVQLVLNRDGRPSGFARVQFVSPEAASSCVSALHLKSMDDRYVEVFLYSERPSKGRRRSGAEDPPAAAAATSASAAGGDSGARSPTAGDTAPACSRDEVVWECRSQMADPTRRRLLLSMLGVALSPGARSYLKQADQGLKHFLSQFPNEFSVDGGKGCEHVSYTPIKLSQAIEGTDAATPGGEAKLGPAIDNADFTDFPAIGGGYCDYSAPHQVMDGEFAANGGSYCDYIPYTPIKANHPMDSNGFLVEGAPLCEYSAFTPIKLSQALEGARDPAPPAGAEPSLALGSPDKAAPGSPAPKSRPLPTPAPTPTPPPAGREELLRSGGRALNTPSNWGTPCQAAGWWLPPWPAPTAPNALAGLAAGDQGNWGALPTWPVPNPSPWAAPEPPLPPLPPLPLEQPPAQAPPAPESSAAPAPANGGPKAAVRLRGLPFSATEQDVLAFFAQHDIADRIAEGSEAVNLLMRPSGRPSGQAVVQLRAEADAELVLQVLYGQWMGSRYIEVFRMAAPDEGEATPAGGGNGGSGTTSGSKHQGPPAGGPPPPPPATQPGATPAEAAATAGGAGEGVAAVPPDAYGWHARPQEGAAMAADSWSWQALPPWAPASSWASAPPPLPGAPLGAPPTGQGGPSSWDALFDFLGPEAAVTATQQVFHTGVMGPPAGGVPFEAPISSLPLPATGSPPALSAAAA